MANSEETYTKKNHSIDESFYSRQLYTIGHDAQMKLSTGHVLITGMGGVGAEIAKNLSLAGVAKLSLHDTQITKIEDLGCQFLLRGNHISVNRAEASVLPVAHLNSSVHVEVVPADADLQAYILSHKISLVIITDSNIIKSSSFCLFCHNNSIPLIFARSRGLFGQLFCDFGEEYNFLPKKEKNDAMNIMSITGNLKLTINEDVDVDYSLEEIRLENMTSFPALNGKTFPVKSINGHVIEISIEEPSNNKVGQAREYVSYQQQSYKNLEEALKNPSIITNDCLKENDSKLWHKAFYILDKFETERAINIEPEHQVNDEFVRYLTESRDLTDLKLNLPKDKEEFLVKRFATYSKGNLMPLVSVVGSVASQEAIKVLTNQLEPIQQWMYFDALETIPENYLEVEDKFSDKNFTSDSPNRYSDFKAIYGKKFHDLITSKRVFMVGAGAIGCELLKNFAMLGIGRNSQIVLTDMDLIERSNLNRQFLFSNRDIGEMKSTVAARSASDMNEDLVGRIRADTNVFAPQTQQIYDDEFFESLDVVMGALDNVEARRYLDGRCVYFDRPWIDSGTTGTDCSIECIVPKLTDCYSSIGGDATSGQKIYPLCTLKYFPSTIEHTIQWSRDEFEGVFKNSILIYKQFLENKQEFLEDARQNNTSEKFEELKEVKEIIVNGVSTATECIHLARRKFDRHFNTNIKQLQLTYPKDHKTKEGLMFWTGSKQYPSPIAFNMAEETHLEFVHAMASLLQIVFHIENILTKNDVIQCLQTNDLLLDDIEITDKKEIPSNDEEAKEIAAKQIDTSQHNELIDWLNEQPVSTDTNLDAVYFNKDDDLHISFVSSAANLKAKNYNIPTVDKFKVKEIAGKIIPAIATTTSLVAGLACIELLKLLGGCKNYDLMKNWYISLANNNYVMNKPRRPKIYKIFDNYEFTIWDKHTISGDCTIKDIIDQYNEIYNINVFTINLKEAILYAPHTSTERLKMKISEAIMEVKKINILPENNERKSIKLEISAEEDDVEKLPDCIIKIF